MKCSGNDNKRPDIYPLFFFFSLPSCGQTSPKKKQKEYEHARMYLQNMKKTIDDDGEKYIYSHSSEVFFFLKKSFFNRLVPFVLLPYDVSAVLLFPLSHVIIYVSLSSSHSQGQRN